MVLAATQTDIRAYLDRVIQSGVLGRSARRPALLEYLLLAELRGEGGNLKAYSIGIDVFDKQEDFDPTSDSAVRVEIGRLRTYLALFEAGKFADTRLMVNIPVGTYRPEITLRETAQAVDDVVDQDESPPAGALPQHPVRPSRSLSGTVYWIAGALAVAAVFLAVFVNDLRGTQTVASGPPIRLTVEDFEGNLIGRELSKLVKDSFSNTQAVSVGRFETFAPGSDYFRLTGEIRDLTGVLWVSVELTNQKSGEVVWNHIFKMDQAADQRVEINAKLNGELETRLFGAAKRLLERRDVNTLSPEQLFILGTWVSGPAMSSLEWEKERVKLMKLALEKNPDFGPAHSVLADKYGFLANMHPEWDTETSLELSKFHAERAIELSPLDSNAMFNVAQSFWHTGRHAESQRVFRRVTELDAGNSLARFFAKVVPYWCDEVPDDVIAWAIDYDRQLSPDDPIRWIVLTWIATLHTNRAEYDLALQAATDASQIFQVGYTYMLHAALLNKAGRPDAARSVVARQYDNWPGISTKQYVGSSIPRLCKEQARPDRFMADYDKLADVLNGPI